MRTDLDLKATSTTGDGYVSVSPFVNTDGVPKVVLTIRTDVESVYEATLDGHPAIAAFLNEQSDGRGNGPWELGHLLAQQWDQASKQAKQRTEGL